MPKIRAIFSIEQALQEDERLRSAIRDALQTLLPDEPGDAVNGESAKRARAILRDALNA